MSLRFVLVLAWLITLSSSASAVLIASGDGSGNVAPPPDDPGFANVGQLSDRTVIYLRNGWVITANHNPVQPVFFDSIPYDPIPGTETRIGNGDGTFADLKVFAIDPLPPLPDLEIRAATSLPSGEVIMIGNGRDRGGETDSDDPSVWSAPPDPPQSPIPGYKWAVPRSIRWGTNVVAGEWPGDPYDTVTFYTIFDHPETTSRTIHEAQSAQGDSGGAVFAKSGPSWELAGVLFVNSIHGGQINNCALYNNVSGAADLSFYRDEILTITDVPEPNTVVQLVAGMAGLTALGRHRRVGRKIGGPTRAWPGPPVDDAPTGR
jgi:hypothetical protein